MSESSSGEDVEFRRIASAVVQAVRKELAVQNGSGSSGENQPARSNPQATVGSSPVVSQPS